MSDEQRQRILSGDAKRVLLSLAWPIMLYNLAEAAFSFADAFFLGRIGASEFSAPLAAWAIIMIFNAFANGLLSGGLSIISRLYGASNYDKLRRAVGALVFFSIAIYLPFGVLPALASSIIVRHVILDEKLAYYTAIYMFVTLIGILPSFIYMAFYYSLLGLGDTKTPSKYIVIANLINVALDPPFIFGFWVIPRMEVMGAAVASVIAHAAVLPFFVREALRNKALAGMGIGDIRYDGTVIKEVVRIGTPVGLQNAATNIGQTLFVSIISRFSVYAVAALNVSTVLFNVVSILTYGFNRALSSVIGITMGAGRLDLADKYWKEAFKMMTYLMIIIGALTALFPDEISMLLLDDPGVIGYSRTLLILIGLTMPFFGWIYIAGGIASGSGDTWPYFMLGLLRLWVLRISLAYIAYFVFSAGLTTMWLILAMSNLVTGVIGVAWVYRRGWMKKEIKL